jgi:hypothetical protein
VTNSNDLFTVRRRALKAVAEGRVVSLSGGRIQVFDTAEQAVRVVIATLKAGEPARIVGEVKP